VSRMQPLEVFDTSLSPDLDNEPSYRIR
jgi:hypothetical protein